MCACVVGSGEGMSGEGAFSALAVVYVRLLDSHMCADVADLDVADLDVADLDVADLDSLTFKLDIQA